MNIPDHPSLRFSSGLEAHFAPRKLTEADFLGQQVAVIAAYVERFPPEERELRALAWIEANADHYRQHWQRQATAASRAGPFAIGG